MLDDLTRKRDEAEDYEQTEKALLAFAAFIVHDGRSLRDGSHFGLGRRMNRPATPPETASPVVTPDIVAQKSPKYGIVAEAKKSLPSDRKLWEKYARQIQKYEGKLVGWWTDDGTIPSSDTAVLVHYSRSRAFRRYLEELEGEFFPSVIEFHKSSERVEYIAFRLEHGSIADGDLKRRLDDAVEIPFDKVLGSFPNIKYYDAEPPLALLLTNLWLDALPSRIGDTTRDESIKAHRISVTVQDLTNELQKAYGSASLDSDERSVEFPKGSWIRRALEELVTHGLGERDESHKDRYEIHFRRLQGDVLEKFIELEMREKRSTPPTRATNVEHLPLFEDPND